MILHNMLLQHDDAADMGTRRGDWIKTGTALRVRQALDERRIQEGRSRMHASPKIGAQVGPHSKERSEEEEEEEASAMELGAWVALRRALITHYKHATHRREVWWLKTRRQCRYKSWKRAQQCYASDAGRRTSEEDPEDANDVELDGLGPEHADEDEHAEEDVAPNAEQEEWGAHARAPGDNNSDGSVHSGRSDDEMDM